MKVLISFCKKIDKYLKVFVLAIFVISCSEGVVEIDKYAAGDVISAEVRQIYSISQLRQILNIYQIPDSFALSNSVSVISMIYQTSDAEGNEIQASGALLIPQDINNLPLLSLHHGTETKYDRVASVSAQNSVEGISGLLIAATGYVVCIADYPGFGVSRTYHPYMHAASLTKSVIDFIIASKAYCRNQNVSLNDELFLTGYSEGGFVTLAVQKEIEEKYLEEFNIIASAPMAGPYDLLGTTEFLFQQDTYQWPAYIAYFFYAYNAVYQWDNFDRIFNEPYNTLIPSFFDGSMTFFQINNQLPETISMLLKQQFINSYLAGNEEEIEAAVSENTLFNWVPVAPIHFFHGDADDVSPYLNAINALESLKSNGATDIQLTTVAGGTHDTSSLPSILGALRWFEGYRNISTVYLN